MDAEPVRVSAAAERNAPGSTRELSAARLTEGDKTQHPRNRSGFGDAFHFVLSPYASVALW